MDIEAKGLDYRALNEAIRAAGAVLPDHRLSGAAVYRRGHELAVSWRSRVSPATPLGPIWDGACHHGLRQRAGRRGRHHERRLHHHPRTAWGTRRATLCGAGRSMSRADAGYRAGHPHEGLPGQAAGDCHRRPGRQLSGGISGRRHHSGAGPAPRTASPSPGNFPCTGHARRAG